MNDCEAVRWVLTEDRARVIEELESLIAGVDQLSRQVEIIDSIDGVGTVYGSG